MESFACHPEILKVTGISFCCGYSFFGENKTLRYVDCLVISLTFMLPLNMGCVAMKSPHLFFSKPNQLSWDVRDKWDVCLTEYSSFLKIGRLPLLLVRFLFFNIISESSFQPIPRGINLIQSHSYESTDTEKLNRRIKSGNFQSFRSGFGDDKFLFLRYFGDKFSFGAVNFHSVGRLIVNYLTERSMQGNFNDSEHLLGLTEGLKILRQFP